MTKSSPTLILVMPAYNEEGCIAAVVESWYYRLSELFRDSFEIIVVNDGSKDRTKTILDHKVKDLPNLSVIHQENAGHGITLRKAYQAALLKSPGWVFHVDSDNQFLPDDFIKLWEKREASPFILGFRQSRYDALHRLVITRILKATNLVLFGCFIPDANIPYRLIKGRYLELLLECIPANVFAPNIFLSVLAKLDNQAIFSIPITHIERNTGQVSIVKLSLLKACWRCVRELLVFRLQLKGNLIYLKSRESA